MEERDWPTAEIIGTERLVLEPLRVDHAEELAPLLDDPALHDYIGGSPASLDELRERYRRQSTGRSPDGREGWLNWVVRHRDTGDAIGTVQATLRLDGDRPVAELAWVVVAPHQGRGYAGEAAAGMVGWLAEQGVGALVAHVHPDHRASARVAERLGLRATDEMADGEVRWAAL
ncbi:Protein N-acetyltransferase, RimJ/RimL family [Micromonospora citrea]|uniref:Protein N-acetyltransferase, RimJ/RimL family n=1 Tax=Micromonospora citrea TaxID=47855 RepID=A0A1C6V457_9ACTN|nr:GNAT family N-acetyltransferase [Micromonospora citrea]SCL60904.1 Protein N-acetyltransferase, RimJ/RimL family [Micromonospora citrea]